MSVPAFMEDDEPRRGSVQFPPAPLNLSIGTGGVPVMTGAPAGGAAALPPRDPVEGYPRDVPVSIPPFQPYGFNYAASYGYPVNMGGLPMQIPGYHPPPPQSYGYGVPTTFVPPTRQEPYQRASSASRAVPLPIWFDGKGKEGSSSRGMIGGIQRPVSPSMLDLRPERSWTQRQERNRIHSMEEILRHQPQESYATTSGTNVKNYEGF